MQRYGLADDQDSMTFFVHGPKKAVIQNAALFFGFGRAQAQLRKVWLKTRRYAVQHRNLAKCV